MQEQNFELSANDRKRLADVRRDVWNGGFSGLVVGLSLGFSTILASHAHPSLRALRDKKVSMFMILCMGCFGSFVGSTVIILH